MGSVRSGPELVYAREDPEDLSHQLRVIGKSIAQSVGHRERPLPHTDVRQYAIHQMRRRIFKDARAERNYSDKA